MTGGHVYLEEPAVHTYQDEYMHSKQHRKTTVTQNA